MPTEEQIYFIDRLTAPKPKWTLAIIHAKGVEQCPIGSEYAKVRKVGDILVVNINDVRYPDPDRQRIAMADLEVQFHIDEVVRVDFYSNLKPVAQQPDKPIAGIDLPNETEINAAKSGKLARI